MNILSIDTTTKVASVCLKKGNEIFENSIDNKITHSEKLLPLIDDTLKISGTSLSEIDTFACINGPGSFTGIRIGLSTLKAFAHVLNKKIFSISTLECMAIKAFIENTKLDDEDMSSYISTFIDAKNDRVYFSLYKITYLGLDKSINIEKITDISNTEINYAFSTSVENFENITDENIILAGDIIDENKEKLSQLFINHTNIVLYNYYPNAKDVIKAFSYVSNKDNYIKDAFLLNAEYARLSQAERMKSE